MTVLRNCQELLPENSSLSIVVNDGHNHRRQFYEYIRNNYSLLTAKPSDILNTFILSHDLSLHSLLSYHVTPNDLIALYDYIHKGPQHHDASKGVCIGANLSRSDRTDVYRFISNIFRNLESKTIDLKKQVQSPLTSSFTLLLIEIYEIILEKKNPKECKRKYNFKPFSFC
jgi:hypothetical protein